MIITLTGPTCSGKTTVETELQKCGAGRAVSHTTRHQRAGETEGHSYHFVSDRLYDRMKSNGEFIETVEFGSAKYALSAASLCYAQKDSQHVVIVVEPGGAQQIHNFCKESGFPSFAVWVDCSPKVQAERWMKRLMSDMIVGKEVVGNYTDRLHMMLSVETQWRECTHKYGAILDHGSCGKSYDLFLSSTSVSAERLAQTVLAAVN